MVILEIGAGTAVPTIRRISERVVQRRRTTLVRINPDAQEADDGTMLVPLPALQALTLIDAAMGKSRSKPVDRPRAVPLASVHYVDLTSGYAQVFGVEDIRFSERKRCLAHWWKAQHQFAPVPELRGAVLTGYTMRGQVVVAANDPPGTAPGGAMLQIKDPRGVLVSTTGFAWRPRDGAWLWRRLLEGAQSPIRPMEYPREPWITRRLEPGAARNAAMLEVLAFEEYVIAVGWLGQARRETSP